MSIVGRAYVTVRAITGSVEGDIEKGIDKAIRRANVDGSASKAGKKIDQSMGKAVADGDGLSRGIDKQLTRASSSGGGNGGKKLGKKIGEDVGGEASKGLKKALLSAFGPGLANQAATGLSGLTAGATALTSTIGPALAAGAAVGTNAILTLASSVAVLKLAFRKGDELDQFKSQLAPARTEIDKIASSIQGRLLPVLGRSLNRITVSLGPTLQRGLGETADAIGQTTARAAKLAESPLFRARLGRILDSNARSLTLFGRAGVDGLSALSGIAAAAGPLTERFAAFARARAGAISRAVTEAESTGKLDAFFQRAGDTTARWGDILGNTSSALFNVFNAGSAAGGGFLVKLDNITQRFDDWTNSIEGQSALADWFAQAEPVVAATGRLIGSLADTFASISGGGDTFANTLDFVSQRVLPALNAGLQVAIPLSNALITGITGLSPVLTVVTGGLEGLAKVIDILPTGLQAVVAAGAVFLVFGNKIESKINSMTGRFKRFGVETRESFNTARGGIRGFIRDLDAMAARSRVAGARTRREIEATSRTMATLGKVGKGAAAISALGVAASGVTDDLGLTNTASLALAGSLAGPLGAAVGASIGLFVDGGKAVHQYGNVLDQVDDAIKSNSLTQQEAARDALLAQATTLRHSNSFGANVTRIWSVATGGPKKMEQAAIELNQKIEASKLAAATLVPVIDSVGNSFDSATGQAYNLSTALDAVSGNLTKADAYVNYRKAVLQTNKTLTENGKTLDLNTEKGQANYDALSNQIKALVGASKAFKDGSAEQNKFLAEGAAGILRSAGAAGKGSKAYQLLKESLGQLGRVKVEPNVRTGKIDKAAQVANDVTGILKNLDQTNVTVGFRFDAAAAKAQIREIKSIVESLPRKVSTDYYVNQVNSFNKPRGNGQRDGGWIPHRAGGGWASGPGSPRSDSIQYGNTMISNREFVVNAREAQRNANLLESINSGSYNGRGTGATTVVVNNPVPERASASVNNVLKHKVFEAGWTS